MTSFSPTVPPDVTVVVTSPADTPADMDTVTLTCDVVAARPAVTGFVWKRNGAFFYKEEGASVNLAATDVDNLQGFTCEATNGREEGTDTLTLTVESKAGIQKIF